MGLDQYLYAKKYACANDIDGPRWKQMNDDFLKFKDALGDDAKYLDEHLPGIMIDMKIGQWRKANAIHQWFVDNCQDGNDDCREAYVSRQQLAELLDAVTQVLADASKAEELLPTQGGFFFGSTEYDEYYKNDLELTKRILDKALLMSNEWGFGYQSSW